MEFSRVHVFPLKETQITVCFQVVKVKSDYLISSTTEHTAVYEFITYSLLPHATLDLVILCINFKCHSRLFDANKYLSFTKHVNELKVHFLSNSTHRFLPDLALRPNEHIQVYQIAERCLWL